MFNRLRRAVRETRVQIRPANLWQTRRYDPPRTDYTTLDQARRCAGGVRGLEIAGLLLKPLHSKVAAWVIGQPPTWDAPRLNDWFSRHHPTILYAYEEAVALGDAFMVVNPDLSLTPLPPHAVEPLVDDDYANLTGWRVTLHYTHPTERGRVMIEVNDYRADVRIRTLERDGTRISTEQFPNLLGRIPVIHIANNRRPDSIFGSPEGAALLASPKGLLYRYGEILAAGLDGNMRQGRPTPKLKFADNAALDQFMAYYAERTTDPHTGQTTYAINFDADKLIAAVADFDYAAPGAFAHETETLLGILYWLFLEHVEVPEFVMGTAIQSSRASAETQLPVFVKWIEKKRGQAAAWLQELGAIVAATQALPSAVTTPPTFTWPSLTERDSRLTQWAYEQGLLDAAGVRAALGVG